jgi:acetyl-CoA C-acetyltransferase
MLAGRHGLAAGLSEAVPGVTVDRQCGSSQQAVHFAAQAVLSGAADLVVAGGVQNMSQIPIGAAMLAGQPFGFDDPFGASEGWRARYGGEDLAVSGRGPDRGQVGDRPGECSRRNTSLEQVADAAAAALIASDRAVREHGLQPRARICHLSARGDDPVLMLTAPIAATRHALARAGITLDQIDLIEINEAFASVVLAWLRETGAGSERGRGQVDWIPARVAGLAARQAAVHTFDRQSP